MPELNDYLRLTELWGGSDLHLKAGGPAYIRVSGALREVEELPDLTPADAAGFVAIAQILPESQREAYELGGEADFAHAIPGLARFRVAVFRQRGSAGLVLRRVLGENQTLEELQLPPSVRKLSEEHRSWSWSLARPVPPAAAGADPHRAGRDRQGRRVTAPRAAGAWWAGRRGRGAP